MVYQVKIQADGRILIPAQLRKELKLHAGDTVHLELRDGQILVRRPSKTLDRIRSRLAPFLSADSDLAAELKAMRREDAARER